MPVPGARDRVVPQPRIEPHFFRDQVRVLLRNSSDDGEDHPSLGPALDALDRMKTLLVEMGFSDFEASSIIEILARRYKANNRALKPSEKATLSRRLSHYLAVKRLGKDSGPSEQKSLADHYYTILIGVLRNATFAALLEVFYLMVHYSSVIFEQVHPYLHMHDAEKIFEVAADLGGVRVDDVRKTLEQLATRSATKDATQPPRAKWKAREGADPNLSPLEFIAKHYAAEMANGTLHRGLITREDKPLAMQLVHWLRSHPMPEGMHIPTRADRHDRETTQNKEARSYAAKVRSATRRRLRNS